MFAEALAKRVHQINHIVRALLGRRRFLDRVALGLAQHDNLWWAIQGPGAPATLAPQPAGGLATTSWPIREPADPVVEPSIVARGPPMRSGRIRQGTERPSGICQWAMIGKPRIASRSLGVFARASKRPRHPCRGKSTEAWRTALDEVVRSCL
jgi:hypothetical protein